MARMTLDEALAVLRQFEHLSYPTKYEARMLCAARKVVKEHADLVRDRFKKESDSGDKA